MLKLLCLFVCHTWLTNSTALLCDHTVPDILLRVNTEDDRAFETGQNSNKYYEMKSLSIYLLYSEKT